MLTSLLSILLCFIALSATSTARVTFAPQGMPNQQLLQESLEEPITMTLHTIVTSYIATSTITAHLTRYTEGGTTAVPEAVQTWYAGQREEGCDRTACASCRVWYRCAGLQGAW